MSSFIVDKATIAFIVEAIERYESWTGPINKDAMGQWLWDANIKAVMDPGQSDLHRLPCRIEDAPFRYEHPSIPGPPLPIHPLEVLRAAGMLEHQCLNDPAYPRTLASRLIHNLKEAAISRLNGYQSLRPGAPKCWEDAIYPKQKEAQS